MKKWRIKTNANYYLDDQGTIVWRAPILDMIDRNYSEFIGPLSNMMVQRESRKHTDVNPFLESLAEKIENKADRNQFIKHCLEEYKRLPIGRDETFDQVNSAVGQKDSIDSAKRNLLTADALATLEQQFTWYVGPIAQILIEKALHEVETRTDLYRELAKHIPLEADRIQFMNNMVL